MNKLSILNVRHKGILSEERIRLKVIEDIPNLEFYLLCDTTFNGEVRSNERRHLFWFPKKAVKKGDFIQVFTKVGTDSDFRNTAKSTTHRFYWNMGNTVWNKSGDQAFVFKIESFKTQSV